MNATLPVIRTEAENNSLHAEAKKIFESRGSPDGKLFPHEHHFWLGVERFRKCKRFFTEIDTGFRKVSSNFVFFCEAFLLTFLERSQYSNWATGKGREQTEPYAALRVDGLWDDLPEDWAVQAFCIDENNPTVGAQLGCDLKNVTLSCDTNSLS